MPDLDPVGGVDAPERRTDPVAALGRGWPLLLAGAVLAGSAAWATTSFAVPQEYRASATLVVAAQPPPEDEARSRELEAYLPENSRTETFKQLALQPVVIANAAETLGVSYEELARAVDVKVVQRTPLISISVTAESAAESARLTRGYSDELIRSAKEERWVPELTLDLVSAADPPSAPSSPRPLVSAGLAALSGLVLVACVLLLLEPRRERRRRAVATAMRENPPAYLPLDDGVAQAQLARNRDRWGVRRGGAR